MRRIPVLRIVLFVVVIALVGGGGIAVWRFLHGRALPTVTAKAPVAPPTAKPTHAPIVLPANAPIPGVGLDADIIDPFAQRLARVNSLAHRMIVTGAEYHDNDAGQRYFTAIVTSCKDLNALWPIQRGTLKAKVEVPLHLTADFPIFAFVEHYSEGQWGLSPCDGPV